MKTNFRKSLLIFAFLISSSNLALAITIGGTDTLTVDYYEPYVSAYDSSSVTVEAGGDISFLDLYDQSSSEIYGGNIGWFNTYNQSISNVYGGDMGYLQTSGESTVNIFNLTSLSWLLMYDSTVVNIYGYGFSYSAGHLSGFWENGDAFEFWAMNGFNKTNDLPLNINLHDVTVPEPSTLLLMLFSLSLITIGRRKP